MGRKKKNKDVFEDEEVMLEEESLEEAELDSELGMEAEGGDDDEVDACMDEIDAAALQEAEERGEHITKNHTAQEWVRLYYDMKQEDDPELRERALTEFVESLQGLVLFVVNRYYKTYMKDYKDDLIGSGMIGLMEGIKRYDPYHNGGNKGEPFVPSTIVTRDIRHACRDYVNSMILNTKTRYKTIEDKLRQIIARKRDESGGEDIDIDIDDLVNELGISPKTAQGILANIQTRNNMVSLDEVMQDSNNSTSRHELFASQTKTPEEEYLEKEKTIRINKMMYDNLTDEQREVCMYHYGFYGEKCTNTEISKIMGIPVQKVSKIINESELRMRRAMSRSHMFKHDRKERAKTHRLEEHKVTLETLERDLKSYDWNTLGEI